jgi:hypothetical protein
MGLWLDVGTAGLGLIASAFWFLSAAGRIPHVITLPKSDEKNEPFYAALQISSQMNRWAALFSGLSALSASLKILIAMT